MDKGNKGNSKALSAGVESGLNKVEQFKSGSVGPGANSTNQRNKADGPSGRKTGRTAN